MNKAVYDSLVNLCVDICRRNGKTKLLWFNDRSKSLSYEPKSNEMVITVHCWFAVKNCPGYWLYSRLGDLANTVTKQLAGDNDEYMYRVQVGAYKQKSNADAMLKKLKQAGFEGFIAKQKV